jgi:hypothetical protein
MHHMTSVACPALHYFSTLSHKRRYFQKHLLNIIRVFWFSLQRLPETFFIPLNWARYDHKDILLFMESTCYSCPILMNLEFSGQILEYYSDKKFSENRSRGGRYVQCARADRHDEANSRFRNSVNATKNYAYLYNEMLSWIILKYRQRASFFVLKFDVLSRSNIGDCFWEMTPWA